ncbi:unnamed protein product [Ambrosiozyma monospora]|uniref:Unnamed protein product n=1 Tax=Ambrosiozyma monospora TaxID=43982 RepID=A0ACB5T6X3_AMBMO|nr:unnamed protein product [Ambrosiozyma monospora]
MSTNTVNSANSSNEVLQFFPMIINNINSPNLKVKRYVYMILLKFNHLQQDISLLSINAIQKSLTHKNCANRSLSIRVLAGIKIPAILPILILSLKKSIKDSSPLVRSSSAIAIIKCFELDQAYNGSEIKESLEDESSTISQLYNFLDILLSDSDPKVLSVALNAYKFIFPEYLDLIHNKIGHLISKLDQLDDHAQSLTIDLVTDYAKLYLPQPTETIMCPELELLFEKFKFLVYSSHSNTILSMVRCVSKLMPFKLETLKLKDVMLRFVKESSVISNYILNEIYLLLSDNLISFSDNQISIFIPLSTDNFRISKIKILIFFKLINHSNFDIFFPQIKFLIESSNLTSKHKSFIIKQLNSLSITQEQFQKVIKFFLVKLNSERNDLLINEYILSLRQLIQDDLVNYIDILFRLSGKLINVEEEEQLTSIAKSSIIWLLGEFAVNYYNYTEYTAKVETLFSYLPDLFRILLQTFKDESQQVKLDILTALAKLTAVEFYNSKKTTSEPVNLCNNSIWKLFNYALQLTKGMLC